MPRLRFVTALEVFDAFPTAADDIRAAPTVEHPLAFVRRLAGSPTPEDAVSFCAYVLGRREAVWWGAQCVRALGAIGAGEEDEALRAAEDWVREPEDERRLVTLRIGMEGDRRAASTWLALGAAWSGGNIASPGFGHVPSAPHMTPKAVRTAILVALARVGVRERARALGTCVEGGVRLMTETDPAR